MTNATEALATVRAYHEAWTHKQFDRAIALLSNDLAVEVPINNYPSKESFGAALTGFGSLVESVEMLSEMNAGDEVMQLYDMRVGGLGELRVVEHFTVTDNQIVRLRQIHDTSALRRADG
jgi:ketosteroid isomerase-like protein